ncbi:MAG TPA: HepT-like ribonuclease domain-containing protein [Thermoanaerobaculia bacterium]|jgi:hypothetical protein|nr:HepT-like ribonuclease domain-containing protein [Thermoanaerobaculia bacterium]
MQREPHVQLSKLTPVLAARIPECGSIIAFRNLLIHGYAAVVDEIVWQVVEDDLPTPNAKLNQLTVTNCPAASGHRRTGVAVHRRFTIPGPAGGAIAAQRASSRSRK